MKTFTQIEVDDLLKQHGVKAEDHSQASKASPAALAIVAEIKQTIALVDYLKDFRENHMITWSLWDDNAVQIDNAREKWTTLDNELWFKYNLVYRSKVDELLTKDEWMAA